MLVRAAFVDRLGPPELIRYGEVDLPAPGPTDVLVDVWATPVNPVDIFVRSGAYRTPVPLPLVVGRDLVGKVAAAGPGAVGFAAGDLVWCNSLGHGGRQGAAAERAVVAADRLYPLPTGVTPEAAVAVVHPAATAYLALHVHAQVRPGETVLVHGGAGNVGSALVVLAVDAGARVLASCSAADQGHCVELGARHVLNHRDPALSRRVAELCPDGVDVVVDTSGTNDLAAAVQVLAPRGRIVLLAGAASSAVLPIGPLYMKDGSVLGFVISSATTPQLAAAAGMINRLLAGGRLRPRALETLPLRAAGTVHARMERGELHGRRAVLVPEGAPRPR